MGKKLSDFPIHTFEVDWGSPSPVLLYSDSGRVPCCQNTMINQEKTDRLIVQKLIGRYISIQPG